ncbi:MAG: hypothetical protein COW00_04065 [Bdellovibrio sp. CG12_big_fil_rev_8_21_14_0_65_39_13]|nr:MAG: hypothetical protein COW78_16760 [Bdellovibrio sp. CG22_combo_CG10-13_8_21_14_all_39_27]PIQ61342.1 MAG: hypothetical protein COW00_04065 [Bdellovibrio sp. CG12_big_fil_rev_8_21_14_0_65_39_13]PIR35671.1 MAG: hypothetical protein COV37_07405 [Bdellovibrio sp. CG11_big_fil_rev_8_21_14_0_20_39_38]
MKRHFKTFLVILFILTFNSCQNSGYRKVAQEGAFDEIYGTSGDERVVRPVYRGIVEIYDRMSAEEKEKFYKETLSEFSGDNTLLPLPRVLEEAEYDYLKEGVEQRGAAIRAFLVDHYSGKKSYAKSGVVPQTVIDRIVTRSHEQLWPGKVNINALNFWYGPDIIRGPPTKEFPEGRFYVVEDNPGFIGGVGDLIQARKSLMDRMPDVQRITDSPDPKNFYDKMIASYKESARKFGGIPVVIQYASDLAADNEDKRIKAIFEKEGVEVVKFNPFSKNTFYNGKELKAEADGVYLYKTEKGKRKKQKVGYVVANSDPQDVDLSHAANRPKRILMEAEWHLEEEGWEPAKKEKLKELMKTDPITGKVDYEKVSKYLEKESPYLVELKKKWGIAGLFDAVADGKLGMTNSPGMEFIGDKEFYIYVEDMIRFYMKEEPILKNMETASFRGFDQAGKEILDVKAFAEVETNFDRYVVKGVDGRGGDAVWVGPKVAQEERKRVMQLVRENPRRYIFQRYNALSTMGDYIGDLRLISDVSDKGVIVADVPWARVVSKNGDGKVNISANGFEATVLIRRQLNKFSCNSLISNLLVK